MDLLLRNGVHDDVAGYDSRLSRMVERLHEPGLVPVSTRDDGQSACKKVLSNDLRLLIRVDGFCSFKLLLHKLREAALRTSP